MRSVQDSLDKEVAFYQTQRFAGSTKRTYETHRKSYMAFCEVLGYAPVPASTETLCRYAALLARSLKYTSIRQYLNVVKHLHNDWGLPNPLDNNYHLSGVLQGIKRSLGTAVSRKIPITPDHLYIILKFMDLSNPVHCNVWAASLTMFFSMLRRSNIMLPSRNAFDSSRHLRRRDLLFYSWGIKINVRWSKTIQFKDRVLQLQLPRMPNHPLCPVQAIIQAFLCSKSASTDGPAFMITPSVPLTFQTFITVIRQALQASGIETTTIAAHSFRRGGASWAYQSGVSIDSIRHIGDWKSNAYTNYIFESDASLHNAMTTMINTIPTPTL